MSGTDQGAAELPPISPLIDASKKHSEKQPSAKWEYTAQFGERYRNNLLYEERESPDGKKTIFAGRPVIHRDSLINGGVYLIGGLDEAAVVDDKTDGGVLAYEYEKFASGLELKDIAKVRNEALGAAWRFTQKEIPYSWQAVHDLNASLKVKPDKKIALSCYIKDALGAGKGGGVCRHQALLAGYLLEKLAAQGYLRGKVSIDRNYIPGKGGHAWVRYDNSVGKIFIIDPAQNYCGSLDDAVKGVGSWDYRRPEERPGEQKRIRQIGMILEKLKHLVCK